MNKYLCVFVCTLRGFARMCALQKGGEGGLSGERQHSARVIREICGFLPNDSHRVHPATLSNRMFFYLDTSYYSPTPQEEIILCLHYVPTLLAFFVGLFSVSYNRSFSPTHQA